MHASDPRVDPQLRVRRGALAYQRVLKKQVLLSAKRVDGAKRGKSLDSLVSEYARGEYGARKGTYRGPPRSVPGQADLHAPSLPACVAEDVAGDTRDSFVCRMARMQVQASALCRGELWRQRRSAPDLRDASRCVEDRVGAETAGLDRVMGDAMRRIAAPGREGADHSRDDEAQHDEESVALADTRDFVYVDQVEQWHRSLVWGQQFDFFDNHIRTLVAEDAPPALEASPAPARSRRRRAPLGQKSSTLRAELPKVPSLPTATWTTTYSRPQTSQTSFSQMHKSLSETALMRQTLPACWRITESSSKLRPRSVSTAPSLLDEWGSHYYGGRGPTVLEHEDVLHTVNPEVFPLRALPLRAPTPTTPAFF